MKVMVFDLDDTLYDELTYVRSGFEAVACDLEQKYDQDASNLFNIMWDTLEKRGRGKVFDEVLLSIGSLTNSNLRRCISIYRKHRPNISIYDEADQLLRILAEKGIPCYIVTDGNKLVQANKIIALNLESRVKKCFITHRYSIKHSKPSPYCFNRIAHMEKVEPEQIVYVGDNIAKDFVGIKPLGYQTIRVMRGSYVKLVRGPEYLAEKQINSLLELVDIYQLNEREKDKLTTF